MKLTTKNTFDISHKRALAKGHLNNLYGVRLGMWILWIMVIFTKVNLLNIILVILCTGGLVWRFTIYPTILFDSQTEYPTILWLMPFTILGEKGQLSQKSTRAFWSFYRWVEFLEVGHYPSIAPPRLPLSSLVSVIKNSINFAMAHFLYDMKFPNSYKALNRGCSWGCTLGLAVFMVMISLPSPVTALISLALDMQILVNRSRFCRKNSKPSF